MALELFIETGTQPVLRSRLMKRWQQASSMSAANRWPFCQTRAGSFRPALHTHWHRSCSRGSLTGRGFCKDYRGLNAITQLSVEPLPHVDRLVQESRGARFFTRVDDPSI
jgi:hypothetical protein